MPASSSQGMAAYNPPMMNSSPDMMGGAEVGSNPSSASSTKNKGKWLNKVKKIVSSPSPSSSEDAESRKISLISLFSVMIVFVIHLLTLFETTKYVTIFGLFR